MPYSLTRNFSFGKIKQNHSKLNKTERNGKGEKQKMKKKILAALTAGILTTGLMTGTVFAADTEVKGDENLKGEVYAFIAASLSNSMEDRYKDFNELYPNVTIYYSADSSGTLQTQIEEGLEADVFMSAAKKQMTALDEEGMIASDTITDLLENKIVLIVPTGNEKKLEKFEDIENADSIALGDPASVPAGRYAQEALTNLGIWDKIQDKVSFGTNVTEVLNQVAAASADAGIVYATDAASMADQVEVVAEAPEGSLAKKVIYPVAVVKGTAHEEVAKEFVAFLQTDKAITVFEEYGFSSAQ